MRKSRYFILIAALSGAVSVALGAFGAHGLKSVLNEYQIEIWNKAVFYQLIHTLVLLFCGFMGLSITDKWLRYASFSLLGGIFCFSGSLYLLALKDILPFGVKWVGPITPVGGLLFILGWFCMGYSFYSKSEKELMK